MYRWGVCLGSKAGMHVAHEGVYMQAGRTSKLLVCADLWQDQADQGGSGHEA